MNIYSLPSTEWVAKALKRLNFGSYCSLCARPAQNQLDLCASCKPLLSTARHTDHSGLTTELCAYCGSETIVTPHREPDELVSMQGQIPSDACYLNGDAASGGPCSCTDATRNDPLFESIVAPYRYVHPIDGMIKRLKYRQDRQLARVLGTLLADVVAQRIDVRLPELLVPMPLHPARQRTRGFNQAQDIAFWTGRRLQVPLAAHLTSRIVDTQSLAGLNRQERQFRILGAFRADDALLGRRVAIIDDVLTTGASARELAREIYDSGAESVDLWVLARTSSLRSAL